jgi:hypothetical protein
MSNLRISLCLTLLLTTGCAAIAQADVNLPLIGKIRPRSSQEIASSNWSVGGETQDREFTVYANYKKYLGPLGAKGIRLQAGWARCEKVPGAYDWAWLDEPVNDALAQGVQPWLEFSYGNPIYVGGGDIGLGGGFPSSPEALAAWDRWVRATVKRYKDRVHEWEIWNEPDGNRKGTATAEAYIDLYIRTATIIREIQPRGKSQIYALALAGRLDYLDKFLTGMTDRKKLDLIDAVTVHGYPKNPDDTQAFDQQRDRIAQASHSIAVREGETGAPSKYSEHQALNRLPWTENKQAKYDLRRMLAFRGKDVPFNLFGLMDMNYVVNGELQMNYFGLLAAREDPPEKTVDHVKPAYYAAQNVFAIFDDSLVRVPTFQCTASVPNSLAAFAYKNKNTGAQIVALWFNDAMPLDSNSKTLADLALTGIRFHNPVYVDLYTGKVYALPKPKHGSSFKQVPLYDAPILIAEKTAVPIDVRPRQ